MPRSTSVTSRALRQKRQTSAPGTEARWERPVGIACRRTYRRPAVELKPGPADHGADQDFAPPALLLEVMRRGVLLVVVLGLVSASVVVSGAGALVSRSSAPGDRRLTVYSVATGLQYINTADDRARGKVNNPLDSTANKLAPKSSGRNGPFAGDVAVYALRLYSDAAAKRPVGSAVYTCFFNYDRHALCQSYLSGSRPEARSWAPGRLTSRFRRSRSLSAAARAGISGARGEASGRRRPAATPRGSFSS